MLLFWAFYSPKNCDDFHKNIKQHNCFQHWLKITYLEHQISLLERFLKDHVTLKTRVMSARNKNVKNKQQKTLLYFAILQFVFYWIYNEINADLVSMRHLKNYIHLKKTYKPQNQTFDNLLKETSKIILIKIDKSLWFLLKFS